MFSEGDKVSIEATIEECKISGFLVRIGPCVAYLDVAAFSCLTKIEPATPKRKFEVGNNVALVRGEERHGGFVIERIEEKSTTPYLVESSTISEVGGWLSANELELDQ